MNSAKIRPAHLERTAYVYIRQSTLTQVHENLEGQRRQYEFANYARSLGWAQVEVVDDDLGRSGSGRVERPGFQRVVSAVCLEQVGGVFALEASRLARNNRDWHHLVDLCGLTSRIDRRILALPNAPGRAVEGAFLRELGLHARGT